MPVTEMNFPSITICKQGVDLAAVQKALELDFEVWKLRQEDSDRNKKSTSKSRPWFYYIFVDLLNYNF